MSWGEISPKKRKVVRVHQKKIIIKNDEIRRDEMKVPLQMKKKEKKETEKERKMG